MKKLPLFVEIPYAEPAKIFIEFSNEPWAFFLDSAGCQNPLEDTNAYSYILFSPFKTIRVKDRKEQDTQELVDNPFEYLKGILSQYTLPHYPNFPSFQGGAAGYFSYDLCHYLEVIPYPQNREPYSPYLDLCVALYDTVIAFDHRRCKAWIISTGFPEQQRSKQLNRAKYRVEYCLQRLNKTQQSEKTVKFEESLKLKSPFDELAYSKIINKIKEYIGSGDIFQANISHRLEAHTQEPVQNPYSLYLRMRAHNPSPFSAYLNLGDHMILSSSPERFVSLKGRKVSTRPIKGTAPRGETLEEDRRIADILSQSEKDRSENVMIVDLLRNDLSKVCIPESVMIKKCCGLETYSTVHHLVSVIEGELKNNITAIDLLKACFPGGSITGAPKVRAMQIIYELEPTPRGPYCGSIGFIGFSGNMDTSIVIRTMLLHDCTVTYQVGGAVVLDSCPRKEYEETLVKSIAITQTLQENSV